MTATLPTPATVKEYPGRAKPNLKDAITMFFADSRNEKRAEAGEAEEVRDEAIEAGNSRVVEIED
jgi:hypothetical protein